MPDDSSPRFTEEQASRIWRRAAELQAARKLSLHAPRDPEPASDAGAAAARLSANEIATIAGEAGIESEYVNRALTEAILEAPAELDGLEPLRTRRRIEAPLASVRSVLQEIASSERYNLRLADVKAAADGFALIFDLDGPRSMVGGALRAGDFAVGRNLEGVHAVLLPASDAPDQTELLFYGAPNPNLPRSRKNHDIGFGLFGGALGGSALGAAGSSLLALTGAAVLAPIGAGAAIAGAAGVAFARALFGRSRRSDARSLDQLADEVAGTIRVRLFDRTLPLPPRPESDRGDAAS